MKRPKCTQCGQCCTIEICDFGKDFLEYKGDEPWEPCPFLSKEGNKHSCQLYEFAKEDDKWFVTVQLGIGVGCTNELKQVLKENQK